MGKVQRWKVGRCLHVFRQGTAVCVFWPSGTKIVGQELKESALPAVQLPERVTVVTLTAQAPSQKLMEKDASATCNKTTQMPNPIRTTGYMV